MNAKPFEILEAQKKECIDRVQNRLGTRWRNLIKLKFFEEKLNQLPN